VINSSQLCSIALAEASFEQRPFSIFAHPLFPRKRFTFNYAEGLAPNALPPVPEDGTECTSFENAIRRIGISNACEWFGHPANGEFARDTLIHLQSRNEEAKEKQG
jgi:hypothetical protein